MRKKISDQLERDLLRKRAQGYISDAVNLKMFLAQEEKYPIF